ncbi:ATP-binding protein [Luteimonas sp. MHLX1A]|uniref:ATP-binding protein n=1 Tax=Alterluteimonas muca TaxID=2878684 RepID=UPI001E656680|nr:ATP-binding protein [Luteimonas sp. MHLX1A]MCD9046778.1 ATP-binding protein [Luteimonas sp. MHLX1A]
MEKHEFNTDKAIINHFIRSQAGTLGKGLLELLMNSVDAGATRIDVTLGQTGFRVVDNGEGMPTRDLILEVFNRFGFDHAEHQREFGRFGLGRAQIWNFASTKLRTHAFMLDVDVRARGLEWHLHSDLPHQPGTDTEGVFYEPLTAMEYSSAVREFERLCRYLDVTVTLNGDVSNRPPATQKWTEETDTYYLNVTDSNYLQVYNMGVFVCDIYAGDAGAGGTLVTKRGHALTLNVARNDIMRNACTLWRTINARVREIGKERAGKREPTQRVTDADRDFMASCTADPDDADAFAGAMFTLTTGRHITLQRMQAMCGAGAVLTSAPRGHSIAERLYRDGRAIPLSEATLLRFGVRDVSGFKAELLRRLRANPAIQTLTTQCWRHPYSHIERAEVFDTIEACPGFRMLEARIIPEAELSKEDAATLRAIRSMAYPLAKQVEAVLDSTFVAPREIVMGQSAEAYAYTDGSTYIAVVDTFAKECVRAGLGGFHRLANVLVHEYVHNKADVGSHAHDPEFFETFHDVMAERGAYVAEAAVEAFKQWSQSQKRLSKARARQLDTVAGAAGLPVTA